LSINNCPLVPPARARKEVRRKEGEKYFHEKVFADKKIKKKTGEFIHSLKR
jgi:hypothetical protein